jgi:hypothetical protein
MIVQETVTVGRAQGICVTYLNQADIAQSRPASKAHAHQRRFA